MTKVFSTRLDEATIDDLDRLSKRLRLSKKQLLAEAIRLRAGEADALERSDVWAQTCGAWQRRETPRRTIRKIRQAFEASVTRHHAPSTRG